jgi:alpha-methylacyl-CoA racemase
MSVGPAGMADDQQPTGALTGIKVLELGGMGPGPFATMLLADHGAEVLRFERPGNPFPAAPKVDLMGRNKHSVSVDLKSAAGMEIVLGCIDVADVVVEGFRPGVVERLGLGPDVALERNPGLVYTRVTGWGQTGPLSGTGGHDINYIAVGGVLGALGPDGTAPPPPLNLVGDFAGGGMLAAFGIMAALWERQRSGVGQVIDHAMLDGVALLMTSFFAPEMRLRTRGTNLLDGGNPSYGVYETADRRYLAVGALDPPFYAALLSGLSLDPTTLPDPLDRSAWPELRAAIAAAFASRPYDEWTKIFDSLDACVTPVLDQLGALAHPHNVEREVYTELDGIVQPVPAPRFSRTPGRLRHGPRSAPSVHEALSGWGAPDDLVERARRGAPA